MPRPESARRAAAAAAAAAYPPVAAISAISASVCVVLYSQYFIHNSVILYIFNTIFLQIYYDKYIACWSLVDLTAEPHW